MIIICKIIILKNICIIGRDSVQRIKIGIVLTPGQIVTPVITRGVFLF